VENSANNIIEQEENSDSPSSRIKKLMQPYIANIIIPEDLDYTKQVREWQVEEYLKQAGYASLEDFKNRSKF